MWGPGPYQGTLNTLLGIYLAFTMPPICYPTAHVVKARPAALHIIISGSMDVRLYWGWSCRTGGTPSQRSLCNSLVPLCMPALTGKLC